MVQTQEELFLVQTQDEVEQTLEDLLDFQEVVDSFSLETHSLFQAIHFQLLFQDSHFHSFSQANLGLMFKLDRLVQHQETLQKLQGFHLINHFLFLVAIQIMDTTLCTTL